MKKPVPQQPMGAKAVRGSDATRRLAALLLEAWSGVRTTQSASEAMGVAVTRFYQLEARALQVLVSAMEPRPRGRQRSPASDLAKVRADNVRLRRDVERLQSLYRTAQRSLGVVVAKAAEPAKNGEPGGKRRRGPRQKARGQAVASVLLHAREVNDAASDQGSGSRGQSGGRSGEQVAAQGDPRHVDGRDAGGGGV